MFLGGITLNYESKEDLLERFISNGLDAEDLIDLIIKRDNEINRLTSMIEEGICFEDLYNPDDSINPHCR